MKVAAEAAARKLQAADVHSLAHAAGFALDEGLASPSAAVPVFYGERAHWR